MIEYIENGITNIVCVQPFACLPNHVVGKGVIKTIRDEYPYANISPIDYDPGASEANQTNRIKLLMTVAKDNLKIKQKEKRWLKKKIRIQQKYKRTKRRSRPLFSPDLSFRLKGENLKGLAIVAFIY